MGYAQEYPKNKITNKTNNLLDTTTFEFTTKDFDVPLQSDSKDTQMRLKFTPILVYGNKTMREKITKNAAELHVVIAHTTNSFQAKELETSGGKVKLAQSLVRSINAFLQTDIISAITFSKFMLYSKKL